MCAHELKKLFTRNTFMKIRWNKSGSKEVAEWSQRHGPDSTAKSPSFPQCFAPWFSPCAEWGQGRSLLEQWIMNIHRSTFTSFPS